MWFTLKAISVLCICSRAVTLSSSVVINTQSDEATLHSDAVLQQFTIPSFNNLIGFYPTTLLSHDLRIRSHDRGYSPAYRSRGQSLMSHDPLMISCDTPKSGDTLKSHDLLPTSSLGGCVIVTSTCVYQCRQKRSPEQLFEDLALNPKTQEKAEEFGITYRLDVCGLYKVRLT